MDFDAKITEKDLIIGYYSGSLKIRTPKNPDFCVFAKQDLSKKSGLFCTGQTGLVLKIRTYESADMEFFSKFFILEMNT